MTGRCHQFVTEYGSFVIQMLAQEIVVTALQERFQDDTAVDINKEMAQLIELQNSFAANARIVQVVDELFDVLLAIG